MRNGNKSRAKLTFSSRRRHPRPRHRWWSHLADLRHPPGHRQVHHRLLPEVRRRALQEPAQAGSRPVRPHTPRRRQQAVRAQEVRWSWCPRQVPEVLPLSNSPIFGVAWRLSSDEKRYRGAWSGVHGLSEWLDSCHREGPAGCVKASERISVLVTIKTNQTIAKHAADDGQHVCKSIPISPRPPVPANRTGRTYVKFLLSHLLLSRLHLFSGVVSRSSYSTSRSPCKIDARVTTIIDIAYETLAAEFLNHD